MKYIVTGVILNYLLFPKTTDPLKPDIARFIAMKVADHLINMVA